MSSKLLTRNVFIDTSVFIKLNFGFKSTILSSIAAISKSNRMMIKLTDITVKEIGNHLNIAIEEAKQAIVAFHKKAIIIRNIQNNPLSKIFSDLKMEDIKSELFGQFSEFLKESKSEIISTSGVSPKKIFEDYFAEKPPFGTGKKKSEFPDAFVLGALQDWCLEKDELIYVISADHDMKNACQEKEELIQLEKIEHFIEMVLKEDHDELVDCIYELILKHQKKIVKNIAKEFEGLWIILEDEDGDGEVDSVEREDIEFVDESVVEMGVNSAVVEILSRISFSANISYSDISTAHYDKEEEKYIIPPEIISDTVHRTIEVPVEVSINFSENDLNFIEINNIKINNEEPISIIVDTDWPYK